MAGANQAEQRGGNSRLEDYLEVIYHLIQEKGYASTAEIAEKLRVRPPTVSIMLRRLAAKDYLVHEPYRSIRLTDEGAKIAKSVISRHAIISEFLSMIDVEKRVADEDAEGIEHYLHPMTIHKIERMAGLSSEKSDLLGCDGRKAGNVRGRLAFLGSPSNSHLWSD